MSHKIIDTILAADLIATGTVEFTYPTGFDEGSFNTFNGQLVTSNNDVFTVENGDISISLGDTSATVTFNAATTILSGTKVSLGLDLRGPAKSSELIEHKQILENTVDLRMVEVNLGSPVALDADGILDGAVATDSAASYDIDDFVTAFNSAGGILDVPRNIILTGSAGANHVVTITGEDIYGNTLKENMTLSGTTQINGKKAFYKVTNVDVAAGAASDTVDVGWGDVLGLPLYVGDFEQIAAQYIDNDRIAGPDVVQVPFEIEQTELLAGTSMFVTSPVHGYVSKAVTTVVTAIGTGGTLTFEIATVAIAGLAVVIADSAAVGVIDSDAPTDIYGSTGLIAKDTAIEVVGDAAFATTGAVDGFIEVRPGGLPVVGDLTKATATTGDVRGTWTPPVATDGSLHFTLHILQPDIGYIGVDQFTG